MRRSNPTWQPITLAVIAALTGNTLADEPIGMPGGESVRKEVAARRGKTALSKLAMKMKPGTWAELQTQMPERLWSAPEPSKGLHIGTWSDDAHWDSRTGQFLFFGVRQARKFVAYSETTNAWRVIQFVGLKEAPELKQQFGHQYSNNALDPNRSRFYTGRYQYDLLANRWKRLPEAKPGRNTMVYEYFTAMDGLVTVARQPPGALRFFSEGQQAWSSLGVIDVHGYHSFARHNPFRNEVLFAGGNDSQAVVVLSKDGKVRRMKDFPIKPLTVRHSILTVDPLSGRYLFMLPTEKKLYEFDSEANEYREIDDFTKTPWPFHRYAAPVVAYIPEYGVTMWADRKVHLYKHVRIGKHTPAKQPTNDTLAKAPGSSAKDLVFRWTAQEPSKAKDAGYPRLPGVEVIRLLKNQAGQMNHHPMLQRLGGHFYLMTTHHPLNHHESSQGRNVRAWVSDEQGKRWQGPLELLSAPDDVTRRVVKDVPGKRPLGFPVRFIQASDGKVYGISRIGYKIWDDPKHKSRASHHTIGYLARSIASDGALGDQFWILLKEAPKPYPKLNYPDRSDTPLAKELAAIAWAWTPEGGGMSPQGIRYPKPWRQKAPDGEGIVEFSTAKIGDRSVALARVNNFGKEPVHYMGWSDDLGEHWGPMMRTNIPCAYNWSQIGTLPDGQLFILGSLSRNPQSARHPLAIAISDDGRNFSRVYSILADRIHSVRNAEIFDGYLWAGICHGGKQNAGRQDVAVVKIPLAQLAKDHPVEVRESEPRRRSK